MKEADFAQWWQARVILDPTAPPMAMETMRASWLAWVHLYGGTPGLSSVFYGRVLAQAGVTKDPEPNFVRGIRLRV